MSILSKLSLCNDDELTSLIRNERDEDWFSLLLPFLLSLLLIFCLFLCSNKHLLQYRQGMAQGLRFY